MRTIARKLYRRVFPRKPERTRRLVARAYLTGTGLEIGALHQPLRGHRARVTYVDRMDNADLRQQYPELSKLPLVPVDLIADGETLTGVPDASQDFVIASHLLEHCEDPIGALGSWLRVVKPGGIVWLAVPDKRFTFDRDRPITTLEHLQRDHSEGSAWSRVEHYREWARDVNKASDVESAASDLMSRSYSIHFHVWTDRELIELLAYCQTLRPSFSIELFQRNGLESLAVLRR